MTRAKGQKSECVLKSAFIQLSTRCPASWPEQHQTWTICRHAGDERPIIGDLLLLASNILLEYRTDNSQMKKCQVAAILLVLSSASSQRP